GTKDRMPGATDVQQTPLELRKLLFDRGIERRARHRPHVASLGAKRTFARADYGLRVGGGWRVGCGGGVACGPPLGDGDPGGDPEPLPPMSAGFTHTVLSTIPSGRLYQTTGSPPTTVFI